MDKYTNYTGINVEGTSQRYFCFNCCKENIKEGRWINIGKGNLDCFHYEKSCDEIRVEKEIPELFKRHFLDREMADELDLEYLEKIQSEKYVASVLEKYKEKYILFPGTILPNEIRYKRFTEIVIPVLVWNQERGRWIKATVTMDTTYGYGNCGIRHNYVWVSTHLDMRGIM